MTAKDVKNLSMILIACPDCKLSRIIKRQDTLRGNFTGLCKSCYTKSMVKGIRYKFHPWRGNKNYERKSCKEDDCLS